MGQGHWELVKLSTIITWVWTQNCDMRMMCRTQLHEFLYDRNCDTSGSSQTVILWAVQDTSHDDRIVQEPFVEAMLSSETGLNQAVLAGVDKQSVYIRCGERLLSHRVAAHMAQHGHHVAAEYVSVIANWQRCRMAEVFQKWSFLRKTIRCLTTWCRIGFGGMDSSMTTAWWIIIGKSCFSLLWLLCFVPCLGI